MFDTPQQDREQRIRERAYQIYVWRQTTSHDGTAETDWHQAEQFITHEEALGDTAEETGTSTPPSVKES